MNANTRYLKNAFGGLITSKTRVKILMRLFLKPRKRAYLRELASEFGASPSLVKEELHQLADAGLLESEAKGRQILYRANTQHALFPELNSMVKKALGMDRILDSVIERIGDLQLALLLDDYAEGKDSGMIDLVLVGDINRANVDDLTRKTENYIGRKIRVLVLSRDEYTTHRRMLETRPHLLLWHDGKQSDPALGSVP